jgi:hypothetical protein
MAAALWDNLLSHTLNRALLSAHRGARLRTVLMIGAGALAWVSLAWWLHPYQPGVDRFRSLIEYPFQALFAADVFRHIIIGTLAFWAAYRFAAVYLDDIFELKNIEIAKRFVRQAVFASRYNLIEIRGGAVAEQYSQSPVVRVGGPGNVRVYLENVALFEKISGEPQVVAPTVQLLGNQPLTGAIAPRGGWRNRWRFRDWLRLPLDAERRLPTDSVQPLEGFERLRAVIDLRDQVEKMTVLGRTRDGITVRAEDVRVVFSVYREDQQPTLAHPYPFDRDAIKSLVYNLPTDNWRVAFTSLINQELSEFIAQHTLGEFLAVVNVPELDQRLQENARLQREADRRAGVDLPVLVEPQPPPPFEPRTDLTRLFYDLEKFQEQARQRGVELRWIGVGTWVTPDEIIPERHQSAWRITNENLARGSEPALNSLFDESRLGELTLLVYDVPLNLFRTLAPQANLTTREAMISLVNGYRAKLRSALDLYERDGKGDTPEARSLRAVLDHLAHVVFRFLGDTGNGQ